MVRTICHRVPLSADGEEGSNLAKRAWVVPFARDPHFVERGQTIANIDGKLFDTQSSPRVALWGLGGIG